LQHTDPMLKRLDWQSNRHFTTSLPLTGKLPKC
jgi:hypothetical protein